MFLCCIGSLSAQQRTYTLKGAIVDKRDSSALTGVNVYIPEINHGVSSDSLGTFTLKVPALDSITLKASHLGYQPYQTSLLISSDTYINIPLTPRTYQQKEIMIRASKQNNNISSTATSQTSLSAKNIQEIPHFMGEVDPLKTIQTLPGIQSASSGSSQGLYVRGSTPGQNMILLDNAHIYNPYHLMGLFSVFNGDAIKNINLFKSGMPAKYGGRLASVMEIDQKTGSFREHSATGGIGLISSNLSIDGPLIKDKISYMISGRRTYLDLLGAVFPSMQTGSSVLSKASDYAFYDFSGKIAFTPTSTHHIALSFYKGKDIYGYQHSRQDQTDINWGNTSISLKWEHLPDDKIQLTHTFFLTNYQFDFNTHHKYYRFSLGSGAQDLNYNGNISLRVLPGHTLKAGIGTTFHNFYPTEINAQIFKLALDFNQKTNIYSSESFAYISNRFKVSERLKIRAGLRYTYYQHTGPYKDYIKNEQGKIIDTTSYNKLETISTYDHLAPRLSCRYMFNQQASVKASYTKNFQYVHLASLPSVSLPTDIWLPSSRAIKPQIGHHFTVGYYRNFFSNRFKSYAQVYYKQMNQQITFKKGILNSTFEQNLMGNITKGEGYSYGFELFFKKRSGNLTGWLSYTLSRTMKQFEELNNGAPFPAKYDRRHDLSVVASYKINRKWSFSANFVYCTGEAITLPVYRYLAGGAVINQFGERNAYRMPPYHRLDLGITYQLHHNSTLQSNLDLSLYNVYSRANPFYIYYQTTDDFMNIDINQVSLFPLIPTVKWNFTF